MDKINLKLFERRNFLEYDNTQVWTHGYETLSDGQFLCIEEEDWS